MSHAEDPVEDPVRSVILGACGQLGTDISNMFPAATRLSRADGDITIPSVLKSQLDHYAPQLVMNCTAYNLVDRAEQEPDLAFQANAFAPREIARWCADHRATLVHISTDYIFGLDRQRRTPYRELDSPGPLGVYAQSKLVGEYFVRSICEQHYVIRTCGLYGQAATRSKGNFIKTMLRLGREKPELKVVNDQICTPTYTADLAQAIHRLIPTNRFGLYHITNAGQMTWYELAHEALRLAGISAPIVPITTAEFGAPAERPAFSVLDCSQFTAVTGLHMRPWQAALADYLDSATFVT